MKKLTLAVLAISLSATALAAPAKAKKTTAKKTKPAATSTYKCDNGMTLTTKAVGKNALRLSANGQTITLKEAVSGSGVRYTVSKGLFKNPTEFHAKGKEAVLTFTDPYGNKANASCNGK